MPSKRDKTTGLPYPSPVVPATNLCVQMIIPNDPLYVQAFRGSLADLGKPWTWAQTVGEDNQGAYDAAEMWRDRLQYITISEDCEDPVSCADVADCIETNGAVQSNIDQRITQNSQNSLTLYEQAVTGVPMTTTSLETPISIPPDCDLDILFAISTTVVDTLNTNNIDFLQVWEALSNVQERAEKVISAVPVLGQLPIDEFLGMLDQLQEEIKENYEGKYTLSLRDEYRCAIFCIAKDKPDCVVTFDDLINYFSSRLDPYLDPALLLEAVVEYFLAGTWAGTTIVDIMTVLQLSMWRAASNFLGLNIRTLQIVAQLAWDNPDPDWEILCEDCAPVYGFVAIGNGDTTVNRVGDTYTITGGWVGPGGSRFIYISRSKGGVTDLSTMTYTALSVSGVTGFDWGDATTTHTTTPPTSAPPPDVRYAGGGKASGSLSTMIITITTTMPFQGVLNG